MSGREGNSEASVTAAVVAATLLLSRDDPRLARLVDAGAVASVEACVRATIPPFAYLLDHVPWPLLERSARAAERLLSPGFIAHYALRKHVIRTHVLEAVADGFSQVVLLGAGFDMLSASLPEGARVFEVDLPATQELKLRAIGPSAQPNVRFVPLDLRDGRVRDALDAADGYDPRAPTVFVAEGLLMYLPSHRVDALLADLVACTTGDRRVVLSMITPDRRGRYRMHTQRRLVDACMRWLDEPFLWGIRRDEIGPLLRAHGLEIDALDCTTTVRDRLLGGRGRRIMPRATGELVVVGTSRAPRAGMAMAG